MIKNYSNKLFPYIRKCHLTSNFLIASRSLYNLGLPLKHYSQENSSDDNLFISENTTKEFFPIQKKILEDLIAESEEYAEYNSILQILRDFSGSSEFSLDKFKLVVNYIIENQPVDSVMCKLFESVFLKNLNTIDYQTKSNSVMLIGEQIDKKKLQFQEDHWMLILKDFQKLVENMNFQDYYNYITTFDKLFVKRTTSDYSKYFREFENFLQVGNLNIFNSGSIKIDKLSDLILFSKLTHNGILKISNISDIVWFQIGKVIQNNAHEMNIYEVLVATSLFINLHEVTGKTNFLLAEALTEVNTILYFMIKKFDLNYYILFMYTNGGDKLNIFNSYSRTNLDKTSNANNSQVNDSFLPEDSFLQTLIRIYTSQIKNKEDLVVFKEFRVLHFLAREVRYKEIEFWNIIANKILEFMSNDFIKIKNDIMPKKLLSNSSMSSEEKMRYLDKCNMQLMVYVGMIIETFGNVNYTAPEFWDPFLQKVNEFVNFKNKDIFTVLNFVSLGCRRIYKKEIFSDVWDKLIALMDSKLKQILKHKQIVDFVIKVNTYASKNEPINLEELNLCLNKLFLSQNEPSDITPIKLFSTFFGLMESKVKEDEKVHIN